MTELRKSDTVKRGYLQSVQEPNWSGLTRVTFRDTLGIAPGTQYTICFVDPDFGLRNLIAALGFDGEFTQQSARIPVEYVIDGYGLLSQISLLETQE